MKFHKATKALSLVQSDMQDIYSQGEKLMECGQKLESQRQSEGEREREGVETHSENVSAYFAEIIKQLHFLR